MQCTCYGPYNDLPDDASVSPLETHFISKNRFRYNWRNCEMLFSTADTKQSLLRQHVTACKTDVFSPFVHDGKAHIIYLASSRYTMSWVQSGRSLILDPSWLN